jgi:hypothetical protein
VSVALKCTNCGSGSVAALFYRGPDAHVCRACGAPFELADPARDRRSGADRRGYEGDTDGYAEWRNGEDRRRAESLDPRRRLATPSAA